MSHTLLVYRQVSREKFENETFITKDDILALVERGSFVFDNGSGLQSAGPLEAVNFRQGVFYRRRVTEPTVLSLFRYRANSDLFGKGKVVFQDLERIRSTLRMLRLSDVTVQPHDLSCKQVLFADLVNQYRLENAARWDSPQNGDKLVTAACAYIRDNLHTKLNLSDLATRNFLSYVQFSRRFKAATGTTPQEYLAALRLKRAQQLLSETKLPVKEISLQCGFVNEYYFSNFFRSHCGIPPTRYRSMVKTTDAEPRV